MFLSDRVKALPDDLLKRLNLALGNFDCGDFPCGQCPLCDMDGVCISVAVATELACRKS